MLRHLVSGFALVALLAPATSRAQQEPGQWMGDEPAPGGYQQPPDNQPYDRDGYDVSVELNGTVDFDTFHGALAPYGEWVNAGGYGRAWRPRVAAGWRPYYYGRWEWTNEGWLWVSDEPFGWAAYHYGRWTYDGYYGWVWVPGYQWAPAWVTWRYSGDAVGWAPLAPGVSVYVSTYPFADVWWTFVPTTRFCSYPVYSVAYAPNYTRRWFDNTAPAPPRAYPGGRPGPGRGPAWGGPAPRVIEQRAGRAITPVRVVPAPRPGVSRIERGEVQIYRPEARPAPGRGGPMQPGFGNRYQVPDRGGARGAPAPGPGPGMNPAPGRGGGERERGPSGSQAPVYNPPPARSYTPPAQPDHGGRGAPGYSPPARGGERERGPASSYTPPPAPTYSPPPARSYTAPAQPQPDHGGGRAAPAPAQGGGRGGGERGGGDRGGRGDRHDRR